jgi:hypothetical protein
VKRARVGARPGCQLGHWERVVTDQIGDAELGDRGDRLRPEEAAEHIQELGANGRRDDRGIVAQGARRHRDAWAATPWLLERRNR